MIQTCRASGFYPSATHNNSCQKKIFFRLVKYTLPLQAASSFVCRYKSQEIVDFFRNFTVAVVGVGDVCSFAQMDVRRHGNPVWQADAPHPNQQSGVCQILFFSAVLRIRDVYPGSLIPFFSLPDPGSEFSPSRIRIKEFKYFNPKKLFQSTRKYDLGCS